jgi:hypothetical protein
VFVLSNNLTCFEKGPLSFDDGRSWLLLIIPLYGKGSEPHWTEDLMAHFRLLSFHYILNFRYDTDRTENTAFNSSHIVACIFVTAGTCLPSRYLSTKGEGCKETQTARRSHKPPIIFQNKENRIKVKKKKSLVWIRSRKPRLTAVGIRCAGHAKPSTRKGWH